jgi:hypothetical protein
VFDFGIFAPPNFARGAQWSQKGPQMGNKIGFGAKQKNVHTPMGALHSLGTFRDSFIFIVIRRKKTKKKL